MEENQKALTHAQHTRVLLYRDSVDDAVGFVHVRDALRLLSKDQFTKSSLLRAVREIYYTPESTPLHTLMYKPSSGKERIALVVDEYGDIMGLVTLEDILEELSVTLPPVWFQTTVRKHTYNRMVQYWLMVVPTSEN